jgi:anti-anti-sigma factor
MSISAVVDNFSAMHTEAPASVAEGRDGIVLSLSGSFDMKLASEVEGFLVSVIDLVEMGRPLILDLSGVDYMSSTGIGSLVTSLVRAKRRNVRLVVRNMTPKVRSVFELLGFMQFFNEDGADD